MSLSSLWRGRILASSGLVLLCACLATADGAAVTGLVEDSSHASVPDASVVLRGPDEHAVGNSRSNVNGRFRLVTKPGVYSLEVSHPGFKTYSAKFHLPNTASQPVTVVLELADKTERVEVNGGADAAGVSTDPAENKDAATVDDKMLDQLPVFDQDYIGTLSNFLDAGSVGTLGTTIVVDGLEQKDAGVTPSAIQSVKINNDPYSAEYSRPGRGRIEIITKAAESSLHGTANFIFRDFHLNARNPFATENPPEQRRIFEGDLTGPVARSKTTSFLLSLDYRQDNVQSVVVAQLPSGPLHENVPTPLRATDGAGRISHDFSENHTASLQFTYEGQSGRDQLGTGQGGGGGQAGKNQALGGYVLPEVGYNFNSVERHLTFTDRFVFTPNLLNQFQIMYERNRDEATNVTDAPQIDVQGAFIRGGANAAQLATENNIDVRDVVSWTRGAHTVKAGVAMPNMSRRALDDFTNRLGTFNFANLTDFNLGIPNSFTRQTGPDRFVFWWKEVGTFVQDQVRVRPNLTLTFGVRWDWQNYVDDNDNFAPRFSAAYALGKNRKTVLRAGSGMFYDRTGQRPISSLVRYSLPSEKNLLIVDPSYPNPLSGGLSLLPAAPDVFRFSPGMRTPYMLQYSAGIERQVFRSATLAATYRGAVGVALYRSLDANQPLPPFFTSRPDPAIGLYQQVQSSGRQTSNALDISLTGKVSRRLSGMVQYTFSKTMNNTGGINYIAPDAYDLSGEYGRADFDQRHRLTMLMTSNLYRWLKLGFGVTAASGTPYTLTSGEDLFHTGRADARPPGVGRNTLQGPIYRELDVRWSHDFPLSSKGDKGPVATFAFDAFNITNTVNYSQYIGNERSPFFGHAISAYAPRRLQATVRFEF